MLPNWRKAWKPGPGDGVNKENRYNNIARGPPHGTGRKVIPPRCPVCLDLRPELMMPLGPGHRAVAPALKDAVLAAKKGCQPCWAIVTAIERLLLTREEVVGSRPAPTAAVVDVTTVAPTNTTDTNKVPVVFRTLAEFGAEAPDAWRHAHVACEGFWYGSSHPSHSVVVGGGVMPLRVFVPLRAVHQILLFTKFPEPQPRPSLSFEPVSPPGSRSRGGRSRRPPVRQPFPWPLIGQGRCVTAKLHSRRRRNLIGRWLDDCRAHHAHCTACVDTVVPDLATVEPSPTALRAMAHFQDQRRRHRRQFPVSVRMLQLGKNPRMSMRLVEVPFVDVENRVPYGIVSHFPEFAGPWRTTSKNLAARRQSFPWRDLPLAYQEALETLWEQGIDHVFMEELCVCQDDREECDRYDGWTGEICRRSQLTLMLTRVDDPRVSAFGRRHRTLDALGRRPREPQRPGPESAGSRPAPAADADVIDSVELKLSHNGVVYPVYASLPMTGAHASFEHVDWATFWRPQPPPANDGPRAQHLRSLYLAHRFLSTRVVHVHESELVWECVARTQCECGWLDNRPPQNPAQLSPLLLLDHPEASRLPALASVTVRQSLLPGARHGVDLVRMGSGTRAMKLATELTRLVMGTWGPGPMRIPRLLTYMLPRSRDERLRTMAMLAPRLVEIPRSEDLERQRWLGVAAELGLPIGDATNTALCSALVWRVRLFSSPLDFTKLPGRLCCFNNYEHGYHGYTSKNWDLPPKANAPSWSFLSLRLREARIAAAYGCSGPAQQRFDTATVLGIREPSEQPFRTDTDHEQQQHVPAVAKWLPHYRLDIECPVATATVDGLLLDLLEPHRDKIEKRFSAKDSDDSDDDKAAEDAALVGFMDDVLDGDVSSPQQLPWRVWQAARPFDEGQRLKLNAGSKSRGHPHLGLVRVFPDTAEPWTLRPGASPRERPREMRECRRPLGVNDRPGANGLIPSPDHTGCDCPRPPPHPQQPSQPPSSPVQLKTQPSKSLHSQSPPGLPVRSGLEPAQPGVPATPADPPLPAAASPSSATPPNAMDEQPNNASKNASPFTACDNHIPDSPPSPPRQHPRPPPQPKPRPNRVFLLRLFVLDSRINVRPGGLVQWWPRDNTAFVDVGIVATYAHHGLGPDGSDNIELERIGVFDYARNVDDVDVFATKPRLTVTLV